MPHRSSSSLPRTRRIRLLRWIVLTLVALFAACLADAGIGLDRGYQGYQQIRRAESLIKNDVSRHQIDHFPAALQDLRAGLQNLRTALNWMPYLRYVAYRNIGQQYQNLGYAVTAGQYINLALVEMHPAIQKCAPLLGLRNLSRNGSRDMARPVTGKTLVQSLLRILPVVSPSLQHSLPYWQQADKLIGQIKWKAFQGTLGGARTARFETDSKFFTQFAGMIPVILHSSQVLKQALGIPVPQRYLILFQNSGELRPTGGFITAYSLVTLHNGRIGAISSHDIYSLQNLITYRPSAPPILHYVYTMHWHLRDANIFPNLPTSALAINRFYSSIKNPGFPPVNGMIFVNTWLVDDLLKITGPLTMPSAYHHVVITAQNANTEMEVIAEHSGLPSSTRKAFIGVMMQNLFARTMASSGSQTLRVLHVIGEGLTQKSLMLWFRNPQAERLAAQHNWAGTITTHEPSDYLEVVDMNLGGHKDNFFLHETVKVTIRIQNHRALETDTVNWFTSALDNGWLVVPYQSYVRIYVPLGSQMVSIVHGNGPLFDYNNLVVDKTVLGRHVSLPGRTSPSQPLKRGSLSMTYRLPKNLPLTSLQIQKQPGIPSETFIISFGSYHRTFTVSHDMDIPLPPYHP